MRTGSGSHVTNARAARNAIWLARYADGDTLEAIANEWGVSRQRVQQVLRASSEYSALEARRVRARKRAADRAAAIAEFLRVHEGTVADLAREGNSREQAIRTLTSIDDTLDPALIAEALHHSRVPFARAADPRKSDDLIEAGIWFLVGVRNRLQGGLPRALETLEGDVIRQVRQTLEEQGVVDPEAVESVLVTIGAAQRRARIDTELSITGAAYDRLRALAITRFGLSSAKGTNYWPQTRQTVMARFGGWNEALESLGLRIADRGRAKGLVKFDADGYLDAIADFVAEMEARNERPTHDRYQKWARDQVERALPSASALRKHFETWTRAVRVGKGIG